MWRNVKSPGSPAWKSLGSKSTWKLGRGVALSGSSVELHNVNSMSQRRDGIFTIQNLSCICHIKFR